MNERSTTLYSLTRRGTPLKDHLFCDGKHMPIDQIEWEEEKITKPDGTKRSLCWPKGYKQFPVLHLGLPESGIDIEVYRANDRSVPGEFYVFLDELGNPAVVCATIFDLLAFIERLRPLLKENRWREDHLERTEHYSDGHYFDRLCPYCQMHRERCAENAE